VTGVPVARVTYVWADVRCPLCHVEAIGGDLEDSDVGDDPMHDTRPCQGSVRVSTILCVPSLAACSISTVTCRGALIRSEFHSRAIWLL